MIFLAGSSAFCCSLVDRVARRLQTRIEDNKPHYLAWNECSVQLVAAAKVGLPRLLYGRVQIALRTIYSVSHECITIIIPDMNCFVQAHCRHVNCSVQAHCPDVKCYVQAHCDSFVCTNFVKHLEELHCSSELHAVLTTVCQLHMVCRVLECSAEFLEVSSD